MIILRLLQINMMVQAFRWRVDDIDGWEAAIDMDASPLPHICSLTNANGGTVTDRDNGYYASADTIDAILGAAVWTDAVFDIAVVCVDLS